MEGCETDGPWGGWAAGEWNGLQGRGGPYSRTINLDLRDKMVHSYSSVFPYRERGKRYKLYD
jgi:hypothetical protein